MTATNEELRAARDQIRAIAAQSLTVADVLGFMARIEIDKGSPSADLQRLLDDLTPHLPDTARASWWWALKDAIDKADPPCGIPGALDLSSEDYDTPLSMALKVLRGVM